MMSLAPDQAIDNGQVFPRKLAARLAHPRQYADSAALNESLRAGSREMSAPFGLTLAEVFARVRF